MLSEWEMAEEIFSLGQTSRFIANQLATMPAARVRRKVERISLSLLPPLSLFSFPLSPSSPLTISPPFQTAAYRCSLVLIDRTLDMTPPSLHHADSLVDRILSLLPHATPLSSDVAVSMAPLSSSPSSKDSGGWALNGSLAQPHHSKAKQLLRTLICSKQKVEC